MADRAVIRRLARARYTISLYWWALVDARRCFDVLVLTMFIVSISALFWLVITDWRP